MHESLFGQELKQLWGELRWDGQFARGFYRGLEIHINTDWLDKGIKIAVKHPEGLNPWNKVVGIDVKTASTEMQTWIDSKLWDAQEIKVLKEGHRYRLRDCRNGVEWVSICVGVYDGEEPNDRSYVIQDAGTSFRQSINTYSLKAGEPEILASLGREVTPHDVEVQKLLLTAKWAEIEQKHRRTADMIEAYYVLLGGYTVFEQVMDSLIRRELVGPKDELEALLGLVQDGIAESLNTLNCDPWSTPAKDFD